MELKVSILKILSKRYDCLTVFECSCKQYELRFKTDRFGKSTNAFLSRRRAKGNLKGVGYTRPISGDYRRNLSEGHWIQRINITG